MKYSRFNVVRLVSYFPIFSFGKEFFKNRWVEINQGNPA